MASLQGRLTETFPEVAQTIDLLKKKLYIKYLKYSLKGNYGLKAKDLGE